MKPIYLLLLYNLITLLIVTLLLILCKKVIRKERSQDLVLKSVSIAVVIIHFSSLYVDFFNTGEAILEDNMLIPIYPCNLVMWLLLIVAFMKKKDSNIYKYLAEFTFIGGTICGLAGDLFNINFLNNPDFFDYDIFKGLISHTVMIFGTIYLFVFKYAKIEVRRTMKSILFGLLIFTIDGLLVNTLFYIFNLESVNAMYMLYPPFEGMPYLNFFTIGILAIIVAFIGLNIYEAVVLPKEERWLNKILIERIK